MSEDSKPETPETPATPATPAAVEPAEKIPGRKGAMERAMAALVAAEKVAADEAPPEQATETPPVAAEPAGVAAPAEPPEEKKAPTSDAWEKLTRAEQRLVRERSALKVEREQWEASQKQRDADAAAKLRGLDLIREGKHLDGLRALGLDYNALTAEMLAGKGKVADLEPVTKSIEQMRMELKAEIDAERKARVAAEENVGKHQALATIRTQLDPAADATRAERWELLRSQPAYEAEVFELVRIEWENAGKPVDAAGVGIPTLTIEDAADRLESYLVGQAKRYLQAHKVRGLVPGTKPPSETPSEPARQTGTAPVNGSPATLTNSHASAVARGAPSMDRKSRRQRALARMEEMEE